MDQVCGEVCAGRVRDGQPQYDQLPGGGRSTLTTDHSNDKHKVQLSNLKIYNYFVILFFLGGGGAVYIFRFYSFNSDQCFIKAEFAIANLYKSTCMCLPVSCALNNL